MNNVSITCLSRKWSSLEKKRRIIKKYICNLFCLLKECRYHSACFEFFSWSCPVFKLTELNAVDEIMLKTDIRALRLDFQKLTLEHHLRKITVSSLLHTQLMVAALHCSVERIFYSDFRLKIIFSCLSMSDMSDVLYHRKSEVCSPAKSNIFLQFECATAAVKCVCVDFCQCQQCVESHDVWNPHSDSNQLELTETRAHCGD